MNPFSLSGITLVITCLTLSFIIWRQGRQQIHKIWILANIVISIWGIGAFYIGYAKTELEAALYWKVGYIGVIFITPLFFHIVYILCNLKQKRFQTLILLLFYLQAFLILLANFANLLTLRIQFVFNSLYYPKMQGIIYPIFYINWILIASYGNYVLFRTYLSSQGIKRQQILYFFIATLIGFIGGVMNFFPIFNIKIYPYSNFSIPLYCIIVTYAILKYRLMDIKVAFTRAGIFIAVYTLVLGLPFAVAISLKPQLIQLFGAYWWMSPLGLMAILATAGPFIYIYVDRKAEDKLLAEQIAQAEKMATIGTMADGLSHQINNRFYALSLIAGDTIDTIKLTDTSKCTPEVKEMIDGINHALERIQSNVFTPFFTTKTSARKGTGLGLYVVRRIITDTHKGKIAFESSYKVGTRFILELPIAK